MAKDRLTLDDLDQSASLDQDEYKKRLKKCQLELLNLQFAMRDRKNSLIVVMEGPDASGKGGAIKRLTERLDPRSLRVFSIVKPTPEEFQHHYLWRFWTRLPRYGNTTVFDRSWYGRVLVERVEGFCTETEWKRAYQEINEFERLLMDDGAVIVKLYLQISKDEQLARFKSREEDPYRHWKITDEDWRNRRQWDQHITAAEDMFEKTSPAAAPWTVIPANYKWQCRVTVIETVVAQLTKALAL